MIDPPLNRLLNDKKKKKQHFVTRRERKRRNLVWLVNSVETAGDRRGSGRIPKPFLANQVTFFTRCPKQRGHRARFVSGARFSRVGEH